MRGGGGGGRGMGGAALSLSYFNQCSVTGVTKAMVCAILLWDGGCKRNLSANQI